MEANLGAAWQPWPPGSASELPLVLHDHLGRLWKHACPIDLGQELRRVSIVLQLGHRQLGLDILLLCHVGVKINIRLPHCREGTEGALLDVLSQLWTPYANSPSCI